jgi:hypothetical protein
MTAVTPITIKGKPYILVAGRVSLAHDDAGFSMLSSETLSVNARWFVKVTITVKDKQYVGTSEIKFDAPKGTADGDSPMECAETSALGRALGFAGYGSVDSIASADEVLRNEQQRAHYRAMAAFKHEVKAAGIAANADEYAMWKRSILGEDVKDSKLTPEQFQALQHALAESQEAA